MIILPFLISFLTGYLILRITLKDTLILPLTLFLSLSLALGLGISSALTFISYLMSGKFNASLIISLNLAFLAALSVWMMRLRLSFWPRLILKEKRPVLLIVIYSLIAAIAIYIAGKHPYGEWDAWGMWNLKTKFLILSEHPFKDVLYHLHAYTHPDYPLLLPFMNVWLYSFQFGDLHPAPMLLAIVVTLLGPLILYGGLYLLSGKWGISLLASLILAISPYYILTGTSQYADGILGLYLISSIILLILVMRTLNFQVASLCGLTMGLLSFSKNEGLVMAVLLLGLIGAYIFLKNHDKKLLLYLGAALFLAALPTIIFKLTLSPPNQDIVPLFSAGHWFSGLGTKLLLVFKAVVREIFHEKWCWFWMFLLIMFLAKLPRFFQKENKVFTVFFVLYSFVIVFIYLSSPVENLSWWLKSSLSRIYFALMPAAIFFCFYIYWNQSRDTANQTTPFPIQKPPAGLTWQTNLKPGQIYFLVPIFFVLTLNLILLYPEIQKIYDLRKEMDHQTVSHQFAGLENYIKGAQVIGYYTGTDLKKSEKESKVFAYAQLTLAPVILELNNLNHDYIIFVCHPEELGWLKIRQIGAEPLVKNKYGVILAERKPGEFK